MINTVGCTTHLSSSATVVEVVHTLQQLIQQYTADLCCLIHRKSVYSYITIRIMIICVSNLNYSFLCVRFCLLIVVVGTQHKVV